MNSAEERNREEGMRKSTSKALDSLPAGTITLMKT